MSDSDSLFISDSRTTSPPFDPFTYFDEAFHSSPTPQPPSFLDNILNPMPPPRPPRLANNGYVDLTSEPDPAADEPQSKRRRTPSPGSSSKRRKQGDGIAARARPTGSDVEIEQIDLSDDKADITQILQKQRAEAVKAQQKPEEKATTFNNFTCVICMDTPTDITATSCGHLFCHTCLMEALIAGENRSGPNEPKRSQCPVCRKFINRTKQTDIIPLLLMKKGLATQPRKGSTTKTAPSAGPT